MRTNIFAKSTRLMAIVAILSLCASCANDFDFETARDLKHEENVQYNNRFEEIVGDIDPDHNWSTAQYVGVQVAVDIPGTHTLRIYNANPYLYKAFLLGKFEIQGQKNTDINFDLPASMNKVFAVLDGGSKRKTCEVEINRTGTTLIEIGENTHYTSTRAAGTRAAGTRANAPFSFDGDNNTVYLTSVPNNSPEISTYQVNHTNHVSYYVSTSTTTVNAWEGDCDIYFPAGEYTISSWATRNNTNVYLMPGAKVTFTNGLNENYTDNVWSVPATATLEVKGGLTYNFRLYNKGTIKAGSLCLYANSFVYNAGTMNISGETKVANSGCQLVNAGTMTSGSLNIEGSSHFLNRGKATISGATEVSSNYCTWGNEGEFSTTNFKYTAGSNDVYNNCKMTVIETMRIILGDGEDHIFRLGAGASVVCKNFELGIGRVEMGDNSMIKATNYAFMGISKLGDETAPYGIHGPTNNGEFALVTAPVVKGGYVNVWSIQESSNQGYMAVYGGNLYVATDNHFADGYSGQYPYIGKVGDNVRMVASTAAPSITSDCSANYTGTGSTSEEWEEYYRDRYIPWVIACEDLGNTASSDFDFNDIVFGVELTSRNNGVYASIKPLAAGGTLEAYILYKNSNGDWVAAHPVDQAKAEIHKWITNDADAPHTNMLNTGLSSKYEDIESAAISLPSDFTSMSHFADYFGVLVVKDGEEYKAGQVVDVNDVLKNETESSETLAPKMFCVEDLPFYWMLERVPIVTAYEKFSDWSANHMRSQTWYQVETLQRKKVVERPADSGMSNNSTSTENSGNGGNQSQTETPNGWEVKIDGNVVSALTLDHNQMKNISVFAKYPSSKLEDVTSQVTFSVKDNVNGIEIDDNNKIKGNLPIVIDSDIAPIYSFSKKSGSDFDEISDTKAVNGMLEVESTKTITYKAQSEVNGIVEAKINGTTVASFNVKVNPEAITETNATKTETYNNVVWSGLVSGNGLSCNYNFSQSTTGNIYATLVKSDNTETEPLTWAVDVKIDAIIGSTFTLYRTDKFNGYQTGDENNNVITVPSSLFSNANNIVEIEVNLSQQAGNINVQFGNYNVYCNNIGVIGYCSKGTNTYTFKLTGDRLAHLKANGIKFSNGDAKFISSIKFTIDGQMFSSAAFPAGTTTTITKDDFYAFYFGDVEANNPVITIPAERFVNAQQKVEIIVHRSQNANNIKVEYGNEFYVSNAKGYGYCSVSDYSFSIKLTGDKLAKLKTNGIKFSNSDPKFFTSIDIIIDCDVYPSAAFVTGTTTINSSNFYVFYEGDITCDNPVINIPKERFANATEEVEVEIHTSQSADNTYINFGTNFYFTQLQDGDRSTYCSKGNNLYTIKINGNRLTELKNNGLKLSNGDAKYITSIVLKIK